MFGFTNQDFALLEEYTTRVAAEKAGLEDIYLPLDDLRNEIRQRAPELAQALAKLHEAYRERLDFQKQLDASGGGTEADQGRANALHGRTTSAAQAFSAALRR